jgi:hypothetical protein
LKPEVVKNVRWCDDDDSLIDSHLFHVIAHLFTYRNAGTCLTSTETVEEEETVVWSMKGEKVADKVLMREKLKV